MCTHCTGWRHELVGAMKWRAYVFLGLAGLAVVLAVAAFQQAPGYMDADYYFSGGQRLADGFGFSELVLWNYLGDPAGLPHPSHGYWMPLVSILTAGGMKLFGRTDFQSARLLLVLLAALIPPLTAALGWRLNRSQGAGWFAGLLALLPVFYLAYLPTSDSFAVLMVLGGLFFLLLAGEPRMSVGRATALGLLAGLVHLARADGLLWLGLALLAVWLAGRRQIARAVGSGEAPARWLLHGLACLAGYALVMGPWFGRNLAVFGSPLAPGGGSGLWLLDYDELFLYPASTLTFQRWLQAGVGAALRARLWAAGLNLQTGVGVQAGIVLFPLVLAGFWRLRQALAVQLGGLAWLLIFLVMTLFFPFQGARGGFFHSGAALQPLLWAVVPAGLDALVGWAATRRGWNFRQARAVFRAGLVAMYLLLGIWTAYMRVAGPQGDGQAWNGGWERYRAAEAALVAAGAQPGEVVMVNNAPGYFVAAGRPAISIPFGDLQSVHAAAQQYQARYLVLEVAQIQGGVDPFETPGSQPGLEYLGAAGDLQLYRFSETSGLRHQDGARPEW